MNQNYHDDPEGLRDLIVAQALGTLDGRERSLLLQHVEHCDRCAQELDELLGAVDAVALATPGEDPPVGFESGVLTRITSESRTSVRRRPLVAWFALAAAAVALAFGLGFAVNSLGVNSTHPGISTVLQAPLNHAGHSVGTVYAFTGSPDWMVVSAQATTPAQTVNCVVVTRDGVRHSVGNFALTTPASSWSVPLPVKAASVASVELVDSSGTILATTDGAGWSRGYTPASAAAIHWSA
jgi:hypothetical protein